MSVCLDEICPNCHFHLRKSGECFCTDKLKVGQLSFIPDFPESYYDYGLGQWVRSRQQRRMVMKEKGLIEVGTEKMTKQKTKDNYGDIRERAKYVLNCPEVPPPEAVVWN